MTAGFVIKSVKTYDRPLVDQGETKESAKSRLANPLRSLAIVVPPPISKDEGWGRSILPSSGRHYER